MTSFWPWSLPGSWSVTILDYLKIRYIATESSYTQRSMRMMQDSQVCPSSRPVLFSFNHLQGFWKGDSHLLLLLPPHSPLLSVIICWSICIFVKFLSVKPSPRLLAPLLRLPALTLSCSSVQQWRPVHCSSASLWLWLSSSSSLGWTFFLYYSTALLTFSKYVNSQHKKALICNKVLHKCTGPQWYVSWEHLPLKKKFQ